MENENILDILAKITERDKEEIELALKLLLNHIAYDIGYLTSHTDRPYKYQCPVCHKRFNPKTERCSNCGNVFWWEIEE